MHEQLLEQILELFVMSITWIQLVMMMLMVMMIIVVMMMHMKPLYSHPHEHCNLLAHTAISVNSKQDGA